jgi:hypothetical protein
MAENAGLFYRSFGLHKYHDLLRALLENILLQ